MTTTHYDTLQVSRFASEPVIRAAYKSLAQKYHPDKYDGSREEAERVTKELNQAYAILCDPLLRRNYDQLIEEELERQSLRGQDRSTTKSGHSSESSAAQTRVSRSQKAGLPSRLGGLFCLGLSLIGVAFAGLSVIALEGTREIYGLLGAGAWAIAFGYLSYRFYAGNTNPRFGKFRLSLTLAFVGASIVLGQAVKGDLFSLVTMVGVIGTVFFSVVARKEYQMAKQARP